ncbi:MAG: alpha/beta hydrolase [Hyphomicrobiaceae bacterium]|nr:alpha/beta hydrolase [Hyphomicrobiaceae bacterium]
MLLAALLAPDSPASAEDVVSEHMGLQLRGRLEMAPGKSLAKDGVALILHGTLAHHGMEIVRDLQANLGQRGVSTLAVTLSLGLDQRSGMFDCALEHDHRHGDAVEELAAWTDWLKAKGAGRVDVIGHSRGGAQAALFAVEEPARLSGRLVLVAPLLEAAPAAETAARYATQFGTPLEPILELARKREQSGDADTLMEVPGFLYCRGARVTAAAFLDYYGGSRRPLPELARDVKAPLLVLAAGSDDVVPGVAGALEGARTPGGIEVSAVDGADHFFRDLYGEDLADEIAAFLRRD